MKSFKLTPKQAAIAFSALDTAKVNAENGEKGIVIGQIGYDSDIDSKNIYCDFAFIEAGRATKIVDIMTGNIIKGKNISDLDFLREMREKFRIGFEERDPTMVEYGFQMIDDWINELKNIKEVAK